MSHLFRSAGDHECTPPPSTVPTIQGKDLKAWYTTAQNAIQEARRWKETSREKDVKDLEAKVRCLEAVVRVSKGERDVARKQERRYKDEVERLNVAARDLLAVVREVAGLHPPCRTKCLNPRHETGCEARICKTCDHIWPCPTSRALQALTDTTEEPTT